MNQNIITCPNCGTKINVNEVLYRELEQKIKSKYETEYLERLKFEKEREREKLKEEFKREYEELIKNLKLELEEYRKKTQDYYKLQIELEKIKREKELEREKAILEMEKKYTERFKEERKKMEEEIKEKFYLEIKERDKIIEDLKNQLMEVQKRAESSSSELIGETQEIEIEKILKNLYPFDEILKIKKGQKGPDILQIVKNEKGEECGKICYESKRTKEFKNEWIQKLKNDNLEIKADILVLVTETMPKNEEKFFYKDGIWICNFFELKPLSFILRHFLLELKKLQITYEGKETKMELLYNYLTSNEFKNQFTAIVEGFVELQKSYLEERRKMEALWAKREEQLKKILTNAARFYGKIKGIAGKTLPEIEILEDKKELPLL